jgi:CO/xanthine dehydrogenase Mo-binding subunit
VPAAGAGESATRPLAAAIANAFYDATGVRIRRAPMTPQRVRDALKAVG